MAKTSSSITKAPTNAQLITQLQAQVKKLQAELAAINSPTIDEFITVKPQKIQERFERIKNENGPDQGIGHFFFSIDITAKKQDVYVPVSVASGKKATGFIYQIEGTAISKISTADVTARGEKEAPITQITLGTILYCKIPAGKKATFRIQIDMKGKVAKAYKVVINRINYKLHPSDARYHRFDKEISTDLLRFN